MPNCHSNTTDTQGSRKKLNWPKTMRKNEDNLGNSYRTVYTDVADEEYRIYTSSVNEGIKPVTTFSITPASHKGTFDITIENKCN